MAKVKSCTIYTNGMVISFDESGEQIPDCQGFILEIAEKLKNCCDENTMWKLGEFGKWTNDANFSWYWERKKENDNICQIENMS